MQHVMRHAQEACDGKPIQKFNKGVGRLSMGVGGLHGSMLFRKAYALTFSALFNKTGESGKSIFELLLDGIMGSYRLTSAGGDIIFGNTKWRQEMHSDINKAWSDSG